MSHKYRIINRHSDGQESYYMHGELEYLSTRDDAVVAGILLGYYLGASKIPNLLRKGSQLVYQINTGYGWRDLKRIPFDKMES